MPYAGNVEPTGWKFCNGQELSTGTYNTLFQLLGYNYKPQGDVSPGQFGLPDLRGRFPLGSLTMGGTNPPVAEPNIATVTGTISGPTVTAFDAFSINGTTINLTGTDLASVITDITNANITGISASNNGNNQLQITGTNVNIVLVDVANTPLADLGLLAGTTITVKSADTRARGGNTTVLGAVDGSDDVTINLENLPEHEHDLKAQNGVQFSAIRAVDGRGGDLPSDAQTSSIQTGADKVSQTINKSGGVDIPAGSSFSAVGESMDIMNPYQTINYIIYTGVVA